MVQKMMGLISILISATNAVPSGLRDVPTPGATRPSRMPAAAATMTAM